MIKKIYILFAVLLFIYMLWPAPSQISQFFALPNSTKSKLEGDTIQVPNVSAYFSDNFREFVVPFYKKNYQQVSFFPFPPIEITYPPEAAFKAIKDQTESTYLEELVYPLRDSLFVNGFEPFYEDGSAKFWGSTQFEIETHKYFTKTTLRYYPSSYPARLLTWLGIIASIALLIKITKRIIKE